MTLKIKLIISAAVVFAVIATIIGTFIYINSLNNKITDLNVTLTEQQNEIQALNCQIDSLEKNVESFREAINITNDYIENLEKVRQEEMSVKQEIYETIVEDPVAKEWYDEPLPDSILELLRGSPSNLTCGD